MMDVKKKHIRRRNNKMETIDKTVKKVDENDMVVDT